LLALGADLAQGHVFGQPGPSFSTPCL
jgi:EAL domain-containing protein (putative c-di-GMP-specific phosphodiesterase class I)